VAAFRSRYDAVVIGSGHNGLIAAAYLAGAVQSVLVLERNDYLGGATTSQRVFPDYDAQLSRYAYLISLLPRVILDELEIDFHTRRRATASFTAYRDAGEPRGLLISNVDPNRSRESMQALTGSDRSWRNYQRFLTLEAALAEHVWPSLLEPLVTRDELKARCSTADAREAWDAFVERPLGEAIERYADHDALRGLLLTDGKIGVFTHAHDPSLLQNRCFLYHVVGQGTGEWQVPVGGMRALVDALVSRGRDAGVTFATESPATGIHRGGAEHAVTFEHYGRELTVDATYVLVNAGPSVYARLLGEAYTPQLADEGSVLKVNMLLKRLPKVRAGGVSAEEAFSGSFHFDEAYGAMQRSYATAAAGQLPDPVPAEMYCHTLTDNSILSPELRVRGHHTLTLFGLDMPYRLFAKDHDVRKAEVVRRYLAGLNRALAEPIEDCLARDASGELCVEAKTPQDLEREVGLDQGNIFHNALSWFFTDEPEEAGRWGVETPYERIYRCGSSARRGGAVSGIPGRNAARRVFEDIGVAMT
jgi:phytoene dehydrogenase-like protein